MAAGKILVAVLLAVLIPDSFQRCYDYNCPHHTDLAGCARGTYTCAADQFCEVTTHLDHGNAPWVHLVCQPMTSFQACWDTFHLNAPACDPNRHDHVCHWCCEDEACMNNLVQGIIPTFPTTTAAPTTTTAAPVMSTTAGTAAPVSTAAPMSTTAATAAPVCEDMYLGDCALDYAGRCDEPLIGHELCRQTCGNCA